MIRKMNEKDFDEVFKIQNSSIEHPWNENMLKEDFENDNSLYLVYEKDGVIISYIAFQVVCDEATLMSIATSSDYRKNGYANLLLEESENILKNLNIDKIFLEVRAKNINAINLYKKNNFKELSVRKNYYKEPDDDALIMIKNL